MLLAYLDESEAPKQRYYLGALIVDAASALALERSYERLTSMVATQVKGFPTDAEIHAYDMFHGRGAWASVPAALRAKASKIAVQAIVDSGAMFVHRSVKLPQPRQGFEGLPPHALTFRLILETLQEAINRISSDQYALLLADDHHTADTSRSSLRWMRRAVSEDDSLYLPLSNLLDTIYFGPSHESRLLQAADVATYFTNRLESADLSEKHPGAARTQKQIAELLRQLAPTSGETLN